MGGPPVSTVIERIRYLWVLTDGLSPDMPPDRFRAIIDGRLSPDADDLAAIAAAGGVGVGFLTGEALDPPPRPSAAHTWRHTP